MVPMVTMIEGIRVLLAIVAQRVSPLATVVILAPPYVAAILRVR